jgi:hypothetical protein
MLISKSHKMQTIWKEVPLLVPEEISTPGKGKKITNISLALSTPKSSQCTEYF